MSEVAIDIRNVSKQYHIGTPHVETFRESLGRSLKRLNPFRKRDSQNQLQQDVNHGTFWALKDVTLRVKKGEAVGIIGRNGAGKSTLLKILSQTTFPTKGRIEVDGRVSSLLEVGTGFHPELTGRENIYLNGTILGMTRKEVSRKFDQIVDFSGVVRFIDTPVKHYSSGMKVRLAFSVAAFLEPEILIIDEVLAVGDHEFQKKCLGKMEDVTSEGRTVLFVSHNLNAVERLCTRGMILEQGAKVMEGPVSQCVEGYLKRNQEFAQKDLNSRMDRKGNGAIIVNRIELLDSAMSEVDRVSIGKDFKIALHYEIREPEEIFDGINVGIAIRDAKGSPLLLHHPRLLGKSFQKAEVESGSCFICDIKGMPVISGSYTLNYSIMHELFYLDHLEGAFLFEVVDGVLYNYVKFPPASFGNLLVDADWSIV